jgi:hypothetical protein
MRMTVTISMIAALASGLLYGQVEPPPVPAEEQPEVLTSGPVHEAFAEPVNLQDQEGLVAPVEPPAKIDETPPVDRPQGDQYVWVPGYWAWDQDRNGYIWVSACWRAAPPGTYWVPGYWARTTGGWVWVAGFWAPAGSQRIEYLPAPPVYEDVAPPVALPADDVIWVPPCAYWSVDHYVRRAGYWVHQMQGWIWIPSHYIWTPRGYIFVAGHWDYSLSRRGVLFAPVYFPRPVYLRPGFTYAPSIVIDLGVLRVSLFDCPRYCHYYFGDYYDDVYRSRGIYPRFESERSHTWYDPIFAYDVWRNRRTDPEWVVHQRQDYDRRRADRDLRPAKTYREMEVRVARAPEAQRRDIEMARPFTALTTTRSETLSFQRMNRSAQRSVTTQANNVQRFREQRNRWESTAPASRTSPPAAGRGSPVISAPPAESRRGVAPRSVPVTRPETVNIPKPPITARSASGADRREAAPPPKPGDERQNARDRRNQSTDRKKQTDNSR